MGRSGKLAHVIARYVRQVPALFVALVVPAAAFVVPAAAPAAGRDPVPAFRLPDTAAPERYEARLEIDPRSAEFSGVIDIALRMKRDAPVLWLNATSLSLERVEARQGAREVKVEVVPGGQDFHENGSSRCNRSRR